MDIFCIRGGTPLHGRIALHGAKNAALPLLAATLATGARCELHDCPDISDVTAACAILRHLGCAVEQHGGIVAPTDDEHGIGVGYGADRDLIPVEDRQVAGLE